MTQIYCEFKDCLNNVEMICEAAAIRISINDCCLAYRSIKEGPGRVQRDQGDKLTWDRQFFEDDQLDDDTSSD